MSTYVEKAFNHDCQKYWIKVFVMGEEEKKKKYYYYAGKEKKAKEVIKKEGCH